jgi:glycine/D-amino acid oxidase-like deaminating enzyme
MKYLVIGLGVFGGSAAVEIAQKNLASVVAVDNGSELAASRDLFKFIRIDYANINRMKQAMRVHKLWMGTPLFREFFTKTGRVAIYFPAALERLAAIDENRAALGLPIRPRLAKGSQLPLHGLEEKFVQFVRNVTRSHDDVTFIYNDDDGVVSWHEYMKQLEKRYREKGVEVWNTSVERLIVEDDLVKSVELSGGKYIDTADTEVLVAAGSWTASLLQKSGITLPRLPMCTGVFTIHLQLNREQLETTKDIPPISVYGMDTPYADGGEYFPPDKRGIAKIGWTMPHRNENPIDVSNSKLALQALAGARCFTKIFVPQLKGAKIVNIYSLW